MRRNNKLILLGVLVMFILVVSAISLVSATPSINFTAPTLQNGTMVNVNLIKINTITNQSDFNFKNYTYLLYNSTGLITTNKYPPGEVGVSAGFDFTCFLKQNGSVQCWGLNDYGQSNNYTGTDVIQISAGDHSTCFLKQNGSVQCQGQNIAGQIDSYFGTDVIQISTGNSHTCFLKQNGSVQCQGDNYYARANNYLGTDVIQVSAGWRHTCFLKQNGSVQCQGDNDYGQSNNYSGTDVINVFARWRYTCFLKQNGSVQCQGYPADGQSDTYVGTDLKKTAFYTFQNLVEETYYINATICDVLGNCSYTETRSVGIDLTYPGINFIAPVETSGTTLTRRNIQINVTANDINFKNITLRLYNFTKSLLNSTNTNLTTLFLNFTELPDGIYYFNATACDIVGNCNNTETRNVTIDLTAPNLTIVSPLNITYNTKNIQINLVNSSDAQSVWWNNGTENITYTAPTYFNFSEGSNTFYAYANDSVGNINSSSVTFFVDSVYPTFFNYWDNNATLVTSGIGLFNVTLVNTNGTVWLEINNTNITAINLTSNVYNVSYNFTQNGTYSYKWYSYGNGTNHNLNYSEIQYYTVNRDTTPPNLTIISPENITYNTKNIQINLINSSDAQSVWWNNGTANITYLAPIYFNFSEGSNIFYAYANDSFGNINKTTAIFFVDSVYPIVNTTYPQNTTYNQIITSMNYTVSDTNLQACWFYNGTANNTIACGTNITTNLFSNEGSNTWIVYANDTAGNINFSSVTFFIDLSDTNYPQFSEYYDNNASLVDGGTGAFNVTVQDTNGTVILNINNINITATNLTSNVYNASVNLTTGTYAYYWFSYGNGTLNNYNSSALRYYTVNASVIVDTIYPIFSNYWDNNATLIDSGIGFFNVTILNTNGTVWLEINNTNLTATNIAENVYNVSYDFTQNGTYSYMWHAYGNGTSNNKNNSEIRYYSVNTSLEIIPLLITIISPENITYHLNVTSFNVTLNKNGSWCGYSLDGAENISMTALNSTSFGEINSTMTEGSHNVLFSCNDTLGNINSSSLRYFEINTTEEDNEGPVFTNLANQTIMDNQTLSYTLTAADSSGISCFTLNDTANFDINCSGFLTNATKLNVELYWINITVNDTLNNINSGVIYINVTNSTIIDITPPDINFTNPSESSGIILTTRNNIAINVTANDINLVNITINLYNSTHTLINSTNSTNSTTSSLFVNFTGLANDEYYFNATACDKSNNCNNTETRNLTINLTITPTPLTPPGGGGGTSTTNKISINIIVPPIMSVSEIGKVEFSITLENNGDVDFNDVSIAGYLLGDSELINTSVTFDSGFIKLFGKGKNETLFVTTFIEDPEILIYEVVINITSKKPTYNTYNKAFITFLVQDKTNILKIISFVEGIINENDECMGLGGMLEDAKIALAAGNLEEANNKAQAAMEACKRTIEGIEKPQDAIQKKNNFLYYLMILAGLAIMPGLLFNIYRQIRFKRVIRGRKAEAYLCELTESKQNLKIEKDVNRELRLIERKIEKEIENIREKGKKIGGKLLKKMGGKWVEIKKDEKRIVSELLDMTSWLKETLTQLEDRILSDSKHSMAGAAEANKCLNGLKIRINSKVKGIAREIEGRLGEKKTKPDLLIISSAKSDDLGKLSPEERKEIVYEMLEELGIDTGKNKSNKKIS